MSSTILYKFRSGTTFEALPLPGSAARLFDVKKAIVLAKKLDQGSIEFDLSVKDAATNEEYTDDSMLLPRGTRVVVQRLPAAKGYGILSKIARAQNGGGTFTQSGPSTAPSNFYTIDSRAQDEDEEFVSSAPSEDKELAALRAATEAATSSAGPSTTGMGRGRGPGGGGGGYRAGGGGPPQPSGGGGPPRDGAGGGNFRKRLNADPELREQEKLSQPKKRATGIPRTFLNLSAPPKTDGEAEGENVPLLQPNAIGFTELVNRGGGQSENASGTRRDLDYAIKLTATVVPDYLKCAIHDGVVRDAMILPWDPEGRTTCEKCIRDALTQNGFRDPLTGQEGVSPDDLIPNHALRKAAEQFIKGVMEKMDEIEKEQVDDDPGYGDAGGDEKERLLEGDSADKGVIMSKRATAADRKKQEEDDPFGMGDEDFGGDVFAVEAEEPEETPAAETKEVVAKAADNGANKMRDSKPDSDPATKQKTDDKPNGTLSVEVEKGDTTKLPSSENDNRARGPDSGRHNRSSPSSAQQDVRSPTESSRRDRRRRGPPVGYHMGPAGGAAAAGPTADGPGGGGYQPRERGGPRHDQHDWPHRGGRGGRSGSRGRGGRFGRDGDRSPRDHGDGDGDDGNPDDTRRDRADTMSDAESRTSERDYHRNGGGRDHGDYDRDYDRGGDSRYSNDYPPRGRGGRSGRGGGGRGRGWQDGGYDRGGYRGGGGRGGYRGGGGRGGYRGRGGRY